MRQPARRRHAELVTVALLLLACSPHAVAQQNPDGQLRVTGVAEPFLFLIRDPLVYEDLGLDARQRRELDQLNDALDPRLWSMRNKSAEQIAETTESAIATARGRLASVLTADQSQRLQQIQWWTLGPRAFLRDDFAETLDLSDDQREKTRKIVRRTQEAISELGRQTDRSRTALEEQARRLRLQEQQEILATISSRQRQQWQGLLGQRIDVNRLGRVRFKAPELQGTGPWINATPLTLRQLKGKVVALHFYAFA